jgi:hypothetical protein
MLLKPEIFEEKNKLLMEVKEKIAKKCQEWGAMCRVNEKEWPSIKAQWQSKGLNRVVEIYLGPNTDAFILSFTVWSDVDGYRLAYTEKIVEDVMRPILINNDLLSQAKKKAESVVKNKLRK